MATINLGSIKFNWQGAYAGGTAYAIDDVVEYNGSSYICILASTGNLPTNATYWETMAEGGDVATTLTTQGDILYRDGSGLQRLGAGTSGQALITNGTGANPSWGDAGGGKVLQVVNATDSTQRSMTGTTFLTGSNTLSLNITPSSTSSKIFLFSTFFAKVAGGTWGLYTIFRDSTNLSPISSTTSLTQIESGMVGGIGQSMSFLDSPNSTSELTYQVYMRAGGAGTVYLTSSSYGGQTSVLTAMEIGV